MARRRSPGVDDSEAAARAEFITALRARIEAAAAREEARTFDGYEAPYGRWLESLDGGAPIVVAGYWVPPHLRPDDSGGPVTVWPDGAVTRWVNPAARLV